MDYAVFGHAEFDGDVRFAVSLHTFIAWRFILYENALEVKKSKCENCIKWEPIIFKMMREFQILAQNSNLTTFNPFLGQKGVKCYAQPLSWPQKGAKYYPI